MGVYQGDANVQPYYGNKADPQTFPSDPKYLQESNLVLDEGVHGQVHLDLLGQSGPVLAHKVTLVQTVLIQHSWEKKKEGGPRNPPQLGPDGKSLGNPPSYPAYLECTWRCGGAGNG